MGTDASDARAGVSKVLRVAPGTQPRDAIDLLFVGSVLGGQHPCTEILSYPAGVPPLSLVPSGFELVRQHSQAGGATAHCEGDRAAVRISSSATGTAVWISATDPTRLAEVTAEVESLAADLPHGDLSCRIWHWNRRRGADWEIRGVRTRSWEDIARNYPRAVRESVQRLVASPPSAEDGRLILWHGEPGTGKTNAVLALMAEWSGWCDVHVVSDPEALFGEPSYLLDVLAISGGMQRASLDRPAERRWKLVVAEDADEYLRSDARLRSGAALGRLLNATDGIVGQAMQTIILLTTNDDLARLHPAITRPGRCLDATEFTAFPPEEAREWLGAETALPGGPVTLADLYARLRGAASRGRHRSEGLYL